AHAAHVLGAVFQDHQTIVAAFGRMLGAHHLAVRAEGDDSVIADVHHHDVAVPVDGHAIGRCQGSPFGKHGGLAVSGNLVDARGATRVGGIDGAVRCHAYAIEAGGFRDLNRSLGLAAAQVEHPHHVDVHGVQNAVIDGAAQGLVQCQSVAGCTDPLGGMNGAIRVDERNIAVVLLLVLGYAGVHGDNQVALRVEGTALGH